MDPKGPLFPARAVGCLAMSLIGELRVIEGGCLDVFARKELRKFDRGDCVCLGDALHNSADTVAGCTFSGHASAFTLIMVMIS